MQMKKLTFFLLLLSALKINAQKALQFSSVDSLFHYAENNSITIKTGEEQSLLAKWTKLAAIGNTINFRSPITASWTDNTDLPVNYLPAEAFGGPAGSLRAVTLGQEYVSTYAITPQIDIINLANWTKIKSASVNKELSETNNQIAKKNLFESIAATYYNIISFQEQIKTMQENKKAADSILTIVTNKFNQGIVREQEKNNAAVNVLNVQDKLNQLQSSLEQQFNSLKILCDIPDETTITINGSAADAGKIYTVVESKSSLIEKQSQLQRAYLRSELRSSRMLTFAPTVSFIFNQQWQENSNKQFFDPDASRFNSQYVGLKISVPLPFDVNRLSQNYTTKINYNIAKLNYQHATLQNKVNNKQLELDHQKAISAYTTNKQIDELKTQNYSKSMNQYKEGILSTENLLLSFSDKINATLNYISAESNLQYTQTKIKINNTIQ